MRYRYGIDTGIQKLKTKTALAISGATLGIAGLVMAVALPLGAHATPPSPSTTALTNNNWRVFNGMPATNSFWDINKAQSDGSGGVQFPFQQFDTLNTGSFAIYLENNYNNDLTGKTIAANIHWTPGTYTNRGTGPAADAYVRLEFQDVASGNYTSNDYWWFTGTTGTGVADLNSSTASAILSGNLTNRANWTNVCGQSATDSTPQPGPNCVGGTDPAVSPYDGFTNAMKNVKQVNLSFGRASRYASGVAAVGTNQAVFDMTSFTIN